MTNNIVASHGSLGQTWKHLGRVRLVQQTKTTLKAYVSHQPPTASVFTHCPFISSPTRSPTQRPQPTKNTTTMPPPPAPTSLAAFTPDLVSFRYPHLPTWALEALQATQACATKQQHDLSVEARELLNICTLPMPGFFGTREDVLDAHVDIRPLFQRKRNFEDNKWDVDLYRLGHDLGTVWKG
jgi:hypothetical protein